MTDNATSKTKTTTFYRASALPSYVPADFYRKPKRGGRVYLNFSGWHPGVGARFRSIEQIKCYMKMRKEGEEMVAQWYARQNKQPTRRKIEVDPTSILIHEYETTRTTVTVSKRTIQVVGESVEEEVLECR